MLSQIIGHWLLGFTVFFIRLIINIYPFILDPAKWLNTSKQFMGSIPMNGQGHIYAQG